MRSTAGRRRMALRGTSARWSRRPRSAATIALLCLGAPTSEMFLHRHRAALPPCWGLCVGQSVKIVLGLVPTPSALLVRLHLEWAGRIALEPRRMLARYVPAAWGFAAAVAEDRRR